MTRICNAMTSRITTPVLQLRNFLASALAFALRCRGHDSKPYKHGAPAAFMFACAMLFLGVRA